MLKTPVYEQGFLFIAYKGKSAFENKTRVTAGGGFSEISESSSISPCSLPMSTATAVIGLKTPGTEFQAPEKFQASKLPLLAGRPGHRKFEASPMPGAWNLKLSSLFFADLLFFQSQFYLTFW